MKLVEPTICRYHKHKSMWENPLKDEQLTFNYWTNIGVDLNFQRRHFKDNGPFGLNKSQSESFGIC